MDKYTKADSGCYVDGAFGEDHALDVVADLVRPYNSKLADELDKESAEPGEFASEMLDEATDILNQHVEEGICFYWYAGDLLLGDTEDADA